MCINLRLLQSSSAKSQRVAPRLRNGGSFRSYYQPHHPASASEIAFCVIESRRGSFTRRWRSYRSYPKWSEVQYGSLKLYNVRSITISESNFAVKCNSGIYPATCLFGSQEDMSPIFCPPLVSPQTSSTLKKKKKDRKIFSGLAIRQLWILDAKLCNWEWEVRAPQSTNQIK